MVERFNKTLKQRLFQALTANATLKYLDFLPDLVKGYNASIHNATGVAPKNVTMYNDGKVWKKLYSKKLFGTSRKRRRRRRRKPTFKAGDKVMLSKVRRTFKKGYLPGWTEEIFIVDRVINSYVASYKIKEYDGTPVKVRFTRKSCKRSIWAIRHVFRIEKVLKRKDGKALVRWKGWPSKYDSWVDAKEIVDL